MFASKYGEVQQRALWEACINKQVQMAPSVTIAEACGHVLATHTPYCITVWQLLKILTDVCWPNVSCAGLC